MPFWSFVSTESSLFSRIWGICCTTYCNMPFVCVEPAIRHLFLKSKIMAKMAVKKQNNIRYLCLWRSVLIFASMSLCCICLTAFYALAAFRYVQYSVQYLTCGAGLSADHTCGLQQVEAVGGLVLLVSWRGLYNIPTFCIRRGAVWCWPHARSSL